MNSVQRDSVGLFAQIIFSLEMIAKVTLSGLVLHHHAYLRDPWGCIDFAVVILSWLFYIPGATGNVQFLRMVRVLRPLKSMNKISRMEVLISVVIEAMKPLLDVAALLLLLIVIFGVLGMNLFQGCLHSRCVWPQNGSVVPGLEDKACAPMGLQCPGPFPATIDGYNHSSSFFYAKCVNNVTAFGNTQAFDGWIHFDHFGAAFLTIFQVITEDNWSKIAYLFGDALSLPVSLLFFSLLDIMGNWFMLSFFIAVLADEYEKQTDLHKRRDAQKLAANSRVRKELNDRLEGKSATRASIVDHTSLSGMTSVDRLHDDKLKIAPTPDQGAAPTSVTAPVKLPEESKVVDDIPKQLPNERSRVISRLRPFCQSILDHRGFSPLMMTFIVLSALLMALDHHDQPTFESNYLQKTLQNCSESAEGMLLDMQGNQCEVLAMAEYWDQILDDANIVICAVFAVEVVLKLIAIGPKPYFKSKWNLFDAFVMCCSTIELICDGFEAPDSKGVAKSTFRALRTLRVFKLARSWFRLRRVLFTLQETFKSFAPLGVVFGLFVYVSALLGMQLFGGQTPRDAADPNYHRANFDQLTGFGNQGYGALTTVCQILTLEDWSSIMYTCLNGTSGLYAVYFFVVILFGQFIMLNLFLTILLCGCTETGLFTSETPMEGAAFDDSNVTILRWLRQLGRLVTSLCRLCTSRPGVVEPVADGAVNVELDVSQKPIHAHSQAGQLDSSADGHRQPAVVASSALIRLCRRLVSNRFFERWMLFCIALSSILVAVQQPQWDATHPTYPAFKICDAIFAAIFTLEMVLKCIAFGLFREEQAYLRDAWNWLDVVVVGLSMLTLAFERYKSFRVMRALRAIRPLRLVKRFPGMRLVVSCLLRSLPSMIEVSLLVLLFFFAFAILGTSLFKGTLYHCVDQITTHQLSEVSVSGVRNWRECLAQNYSWRSRDFSFDNVGSSMLTLFEVSTLSSWQKTLDATSDGGRKGMTPSYMQSPRHAPYFKVFILVGTLFALNLFTGIIVLNYGVCKRLAENEEGSLHNVNEAQKQWVQAVSIAMRTKPRHAQRISQRGWRRWLYEVCCHKFFEVFVLMCTAINIVILASDHVGSTKTYALATTYINVLITGVFIVEMLLKMTAFSLRGYFRDSWNRFDFVLVVISAVDALITLFTFSNGQVNANVGGIDDSTRSAFGALKVLRIFRVFRVFQILKSAKNLRRLLSTLALSLPPLLNICCLVLLIMVIYAILGQQFFWNALPVDHGEIDLEKSSFSNFFGSIFLLLRSAMHVLSSCRYLRKSYIPGNAGSHRVTTGLISCTTSREACASIVL